MNALISLASANASDVEALVALRIAAMRESLERVGRFDPQRARDRFLASFDPAVTRHIMCDGACVGFLVLRPQDDVLFLNHLYILPTHQSKGIGAWVMQQVFAEADRAGLAVRVGALRESAANRFYLHHGFVQTYEEEFDIYYERLPR